LLHHWAIDNKTKTLRYKERGKKVPAFRKAVIGGKKEGSRHEVPPELVYIDYKTVFLAIKQIKDRQKKSNAQSNHISSWIKNDCMHDTIELSGKPIKIKRPFPVPKNIVSEVSEMIIKPKNNPSSIAYFVTGKRLGIAGDTVKKLIGKRANKRINSSPKQQHLVSIFLDHCSPCDMPKIHDLRGMILDSLFHSKFDLLAIYYLIQQVHRLKKPIFSGEYKNYICSVKKLCEAVYPQINKIKYRPFTRLLV